MISAELRQVPFAGFDTENGLVVREAGGLPVDDGPDNVGGRVGVGAVLGFAGGFVLSAVEFEVFDRFGARGAVFAVADPFLDEFFETADHAVVTGRFGTVEEGSGVVGNAHAGTGVSAGRWRMGSVAIFRMKSSVG